MFALVQVSLIKRRTIMKTFNKSMIAALVLGTTAMGAQASSWENESKDAWIDGKAETVLLMNTNLNNFDINTDVKNGKVMLTGKVNSDVDKELAEATRWNMTTMSPSRPCARSMTTAGGSTTARSA